MAIIVKCKRGTGDREAQAITDSLISSEQMAVARGKRFLDDNYYVKKRRTLRVPHKGPLIVPETWVTVTDGRLGLSDTKLKVVGYSIQMTPKSVWSTLETEQYVESL